MSEIRDILADVVGDREDTFSDPVKNLRLGTSFLAEIEFVTDMELNGVLGRDPRESVKFHVRDQSGSDAINLNDILLALGVRFKVLRRSDNPTNQQVEFGAMKVTNKDA